MSKSQGFCWDEFDPHSTSFGKVCLTPWEAKGIQSPFLCPGNQAADMSFQGNAQYTGYFWCPTSQGRDMQTVQTERFLAKGWPKLLFPFSPGKEFYLVPGNDRDSDSRQRWEDIISLVRDPPPRHTKGRWYLPPSRPPDIWLRSEPDPIDEILFTLFPSCQPPCHPWTGIRTPSTVLGEVHHRVETSWEDHAQRG